MNLAGLPNDQEVGDAWVASNRRSSKPDDQFGSAALLSQHLQGEREHPPGVGDLRVSFIITPCPLAPPAIADVAV